MQAASAESTECGGSALFAAYLAQTKGNVCEAARLFAVERIRLGTDLEKLTAELICLLYPAHYGSQIDAHAFVRELIAHALRSPNIEPSTEVLRLDVFGDVSLAGSPSLPLDALPGVIANFSADTAARLGCDPVTVALPFIVVAAAAIHDRYRVQPRRNDTEWTESARLWGAVVADFGGSQVPRSASSH